MVYSPVVLHCHGSHTFPWPEMSSLPYLTSWNRAEVQGEGLNVTISVFLALYSTKTFLWLSCSILWLKNLERHTSWALCTGKRLMCWESNIWLSCSTERAQWPWVMLPSKWGKELSTKPFPSATSAQTGGSGRQGWGERAPAHPCSRWVLHQVGTAWAMPQGGGIGTASCCLLPAAFQREAVIWSFTVL